MRALSVFGNSNTMNAQSNPLSYSLGQRVPNSQSGFQKNRAAFEKYQIPDPKHGVLWKTIAEQREKPLHREHVGQRRLVAGAWNFTVRLKRHSSTVQSKLPTTRSYRNLWSRSAVCLNAWTGFAVGPATGPGTRPCPPRVRGGCWRNNPPEARLRSSISSPE